MAMSLARRPVLLLTLTSTTHSCTDGTCVFFSRYYVTLPLFAFNGICGHTLRRFVVGLRATNPLNTYTELWHGLLVTTTGYMAYFTLIILVDMDVLVQPLYPTLATSILILTFSTHLLIRSVLSSTVSRFSFLPT